MTKIGRRALLSWARRLGPIALAVTVAAATVVALLTPVFGAEDGETRIKNIKISVWPEYDESRVLVMYQGEFADKSSFPKSVKFRLPKDAEIGQVCALSEKQEHLCQLYESKKEDDFIELTYTLPIPTFFIEFYYNPIQGEGVRDISFIYSNLYPADKEDVEVQQPLRSADFAMTPNPLSVGQDNRGFKYNQLSFDSVRAGQKVDLKIAYSKQDSRPSVPKSNQGGGTSSGGPGPDVNAWLLIGAAAALAGVVYYGLTRRTRRYAPQSARISTRAAPAAPTSRASASAARSGARKGNTINQLMQAAQVNQPASFCSGCGASLEPGDKFCSVCGKKSKGAS
ncbi:MAG: zinc ribbon domain-containing protein [Chloroflexi bacterium]|nr:zinc ribbon domain-containing protein [Chloroflexota bacterium]